jgi:DNA modification methylase
VSGRKGARRPTKTPVAAALRVADLIADPANRRSHPTRNVEMMAASLRDVGAARSIVIDEGNVILAGNGVTAAAATAGITKVRVIEAAGDELIAVRRSGLSDAQKRSLAIYDNRTAELAEWNLEQIHADQAAGLALEPWWSPVELADLVGAPALQTGLTDPDEVPAERATTIQRGDLFTLGAHRLICGDCTNPDDVGRLMQHARAGLMNTDPPYGISYENQALHPNAGPINARVKNDDHRDAALQAFLESAFRPAKTVALRENAAWYLWHAQLTQGFFAAAAAAAAAAAVIVHRQIIWVKPVLVFGRGHYHWKHELCFMGWVKGHEPPNYGLGGGEMTQTTVWEIDGVPRDQRKMFDHATPKPVGLFTIPIRKHLRAAEVCYEPFAGSGPQFIAAEQAACACYGIEIEPRFCQVIVDRWEAFTGLKAVKVAGAARRPRRGRAHA